MDAAWLERFRREVNYDLADRDGQLEGYLLAGCEVAAAYLCDPTEEQTASETYRQAVFVYARNLWDTGGTSEKGVPPAFYNLLNAIKQ